MHSIHRFLVSNLCLFLAGLPLSTPAMGIPGDLTGRPVGVSGAGGLQHLAVLGADNNIWTRDWIVDGKGARWTSWTMQKDLVVPQGGFTSSPWVQSPNGAGIVNLFALGSYRGVPRLAQWTSSNGAYSQTIGIEGFDSVVTSPACVQTARGWQTIYAIFADSTLRYRQWDSINRTWNGWNVLGRGFDLHAPFATQVNDTQVNVYAREPDGTVVQNWWNGTAWWPGWKTPAWKKVLSSPSSANFDATTHFLFAQGIDSIAIGAIWDGADWTALPSSGIKTLSGVTPVVSGPDSLMIYALAPDSTLIRFPWSRAHSWGPKESLGRLPPFPGSSVSTQQRISPDGMHVEGDFLLLPPELGAAAGKLRILDQRGVNRWSASWGPGTCRIPLSLRPGIYLAISGELVYKLPIAK